MEEMEVLKIAENYAKMFIRGSVSVAFQMHPLITVAEVDMQ